MVNLMREYVPSDARIHYVITDGGDAPNIVPETAEVLDVSPGTVKGDWKVARAWLQRELESNDADD